MTIEIIHAAPSNYLLRKRKRQQRTIVQFPSTNKRPRKAGIQNLKASGVDNIEHIIEEDSIAENSSSLEPKFPGLDGLPWKTIARPKLGGSGGDLTTEGAMLMLEEVDGVDLVYEDAADANGKVLKYKVSDQLGLPPGSCLNLSRCIQVTINPFDTRRKRMCLEFPLLKSTLTVGDSPGSFWFSAVETLFQTPSCCLNGKTYRYITH